MLDNTNSWMWRQQEIGLFLRRNNIMITELKIIDVTSTMKYSNV